MRKKRLIGIVNLISELIFTMSLVPDPYDREIYPCTRIKPKDGCLVFYMYHGYFETGKAPDPRQK